MQVPHGFAAAQLRKQIHLEDEAFAARFGRAMLMVHGSYDPVPRLARTGSYTADELKTDDSFISFIPIVKTDRNQFNFISIGRTGNNDVVLFDPTLSKFHAFLRGDGARFTLLDAGSRNGTKVDGAAVPVRGQGDPVVLWKSCELRFGAVAATFLPLVDVRRFVG